MLPPQSRSYSAYVGSTSSEMEQAAVASLHRTMRVLREELEEREATIRRLRKRQGRRKWAGVGGRGILVTMEEAGSEDHQRMFHRLQDQLTTGQQVRELDGDQAKLLQTFIGAGKLSTKSFLLQISLRFSVEASDEFRWCCINI